MLLTLWYVLMLKERVLFQNSVMKEENKKRDRHNQLPIQQIDIES